MDAASALIISFIIAGSAWAIGVLLSSIKDDVIGLIDLLKEMKKEGLNKMEFKLKVSTLREGLSPTTDPRLQMTTIKKRLIKRIRNAIYKPTENNTLILYLNDERETPCYLMQRGKIKLRISKDDTRNLFSLSEPKFAEIMYYIQVWGTIIKDCYKAITNLDYEIKIESI